jgi:arabinose-5-phosphate isomerase
VIDTLLVFCLHFCVLFLLDFFYIFVCIYSTDYIYMTTVEQTMREILDAESRAISQIPVSDAYPRAVNLIVEHVHRRGGKLVTSGMGKAGQIALNIATTFSSTGTPAVNLHPAEAQHGDLGVLQPNDVMLLISNSGKTREIIELVKLARGLYAHIPFIVITGNADSPLAALADVTLPTGTTAMTVIGDVLVVNVMKTIGFTAQDYAKRHHGGYLGGAARGDGKIS